MKPTFAQEDSATITPIRSPSIFHPAFINSYIEDVCL